MSKHIIWHLWEQYKETNDPSLLADAVRQADFSDDFRDNSSIQEAIVSFILQHRQNKKYDRKLRDEFVVRLHEQNLANGLTAEQSYTSIKDVIDEFGTPDAVRKVVTKNRKIST